MGVHDEPEQVFIFAGIRRGTERPQKGGGETCCAGMALSVD